MKTDENHENRLKLFYEFLGKLKKAKEWTLRKLNLPIHNAIDISITRKVLT
jgi:hypothetical protein